MISYIPFPNLDPIILPIWGPIALRWYNLAYMVGIGFGWYYSTRLVTQLPSSTPHKNAITKTTLENMLAWVIGGIILGGRGGYLLFYEPYLVMNDPLNIVRVWEGGMSFHGAVLGCITAMFLFARRHQVRFLSLMDILAAACPIGLGLGRIANFINDELWGRPTTVPWAVLFPSGGSIPRHPSQLYEALLEGCVLFFLLAHMIWRRKALKHPGCVSGTFLIAYGGFRYAMEFFRSPDALYGTDPWTITIGQLLSLPMILVGIFVVARSQQKGSSLS